MEEGKAATFECKLKNADDAQVQWYKGSQKLEPSDKYEVVALPDGTHKLIVKNASPEDQGNYRVEVVNPAGSASSQAALSVVPGIFKIKKGLEDKNLEKGQKFSLSVEVEGKPTEVKWYKAGQELFQNDRVKIEKVTDEIYSLTVENSELNDTGAYKVVLSSGVQTIESSCQVKVSEPVSAPSFRKPLSDVTQAKVYNIIFTFTNIIIIGRTTCFDC